MTAPSPSNSQPVRFVQIESQNARQELKDKMEQGYQSLIEKTATCKKPGKIKNVINYYWRHSIFMFDAPVLIGVGGEQTASGFSSRLEKENLLNDQSIDQAGIDITTGFALAAYILKGEDLGLGSCILTAPLFFLDAPFFICPDKAWNVSCFIATGIPANRPEPVKKNKINEVFSRV